MKIDQRFIEHFAATAEKRRYTRRQVVRAGVGLGLSAAAIGSVLARPAFAQDSSASPAAAGPVLDPISGAEMSYDDIVAAIQAEGEVTVGNWTYTATDALIERFEQYVSDVYGVDVTLNYLGTQQPSTYLTELYAAAGAGNTPPHDLLAIEENYWAEVRAQEEAEGVTLLADVLPSGLIPNADRVFENFTQFPTAVGFQASASPGITYNNDNVDFLNDWTDLADERLKGKLLAWLPGDITGGGVLLGVIAAQGGDYKNPDDVAEGIRFLVEEVHPNVLKYTTDTSEAQQLLKDGVVDAVTFWNSLARLQYLDGQENAAFLVAASGQYAVNGYMFMPVGAAHPILAQIFMDWRLSDDAQFPDIEVWGITEGNWAEFQEGFMGESYVDLVPDWIKDVYFNFFPTPEQLSTQYKSVDWAYYVENASAWYDEWLAGIGL
ncbi:MAG: ABC transporter substrate-binding protein [Thermomicrobiales bacterium]|nr:ABC transporter substrate-binding protein [Thermomicrobiales bacterium]